jgi:galactokinase
VSTTPVGSPPAGSDPPYAILLAFSGIREALAAGSGFNDRVAECHTAAEQLLACVGRSGEQALLGQLSHEEYSKHKASLGAVSCALVPLYVLLPAANSAQGVPMHMPLTS